MRDADKFCLRAIDAITEYPPARRAMRIHLLPAIGAFAAGTDARNQSLVARLERTNCRPYFVDDADAFHGQECARMGNSARLL